MLIAAVQGFEWCGPGGVTASWMGGASNFEVIVSNPSNRAALKYIRPTRVAHLCCMLTIATLGTS